MFFKKSRQLFYPLLALLALTLTLFTGCVQQTQTPQAEVPATSQTSSAANLSGQISVDGSSTVFPISEAMAEEFQKANAGVRVTVGVSGTGGGFKKFCAAQTDISNASRPIQPEERETCKANNVEFIELPISYDGLSVVVNEQNNWATCLTVAELKKIWEPAAQGKIARWNQIRQDFPNEPLSLFGPGTDSGTFDYFTEAIVGEDGKSRSDFTASEDDNVLVQGVAGNKNALGYFGFAFYEQNQDKLNVVAIDNGKGCIAPSTQTIEDGTYQPLARPEFIYVNRKAADRPEVQAFVDFHLSPENKTLISEVGNVPLPQKLLTSVKTRFEQRQVGSLFEGRDSAVGANLAELLQAT